MENNRHHPSVASQAFRDLAARLQVTINKSKQSLAEIDEALSKHAQFMKETQAMLSDIRRAN